MILDPLILSGVIHEQHKGSIPYNWYPTVLLYSWRKLDTGRWMASSGTTSCRGVSWQASSVSHSHVSVDKRNGRIGITCTNVPGAKGVCITGLYAKGVGREAGLNVRSAVDLSSDHI